MFEYIASVAVGTPIDSLENSLKDWIAWSQYPGPRQSEWRQTRQEKFETMKGPKMKH